MALEDFTKLLTTSNQPQIQSFIDILFKLLNDPNNDVKSKTIKVFPLILPYISPASVMKVMTQLYHNTQKHDTQKLDDISLMVWKLMINSDFTFSEKLVRSIIDLILPSLDGEVGSYDLEVLMEVLKKFDGLTSGEWLKIANILVQLSFKANSLTKKAVYCFDLLMSSHQLDLQALESLLLCINLNFEHKSRDFASKNNRLVLLAMMVKKARFQYPPDEFYGLVDEFLNEDLDIEDLDYDLVTEDNLNKELCLDIVTSLVDNSYVHPQITAIIGKFLTYSPIEQEPESESEFEDMEFSDEMEEIDDGSWKLRYKTVVLIDRLKDSTYLPRLIQLNDTNPIIFKQCLTTIGNLMGPQDIDLVPSIEQKILAHLNGDFFVYLPLLMKLLTISTVSPSFLKQFLGSLGEKHFEMVEILNLVHEVVAKGVDKEIKDDLVVKLCLNVKNNANVVVSLKILNLLMDSASPEVFTTLVDKLRDKTVIVEVKQELVGSLTEYMVVNGVNWQVVGEVFGDQMNEMMIGGVLGGLCKLAADGRGAKGTDTTTGGDTGLSSLVERLLPFLQSHDKPLISLIITFFSSINYHMDVAQLLALPTDLDLSKSILHYLSHYTFDPPTINAFITVVNSMDYDINQLPEVELKEVVTQICQQGDFYLQFKADLNPSPVTSKILAMVLTQRNKSEEIANLENQVNGTLERNQVDRDFVTLLEILGFVEGHDSKVKFEGLIGLLNDGSTTTSATTANDDLKYQIAKTLGYLINGADLIQAFKTHQGLKPYLLVSIRSFVGRYRDRGFEVKMWEMLFDDINVDKVKKEFNLVGEILSMMIRDGEFLKEFEVMVKVSVPGAGAGKGASTGAGATDNTEENSESGTTGIGLCYILLIITNFLIKKLPPQDLGFFFNTLSFQSIINIDIKLMVIKNLITLFHTHPQLFQQVDLQAHLFNELLQYPEFRKVIPMGPYKYVIDEGLEIRKLVFELIYSIINSSTAINHDTFMDHIISEGLTDKEPDILNLAFISLSKLISIHPTYLNSPAHLQLLVDNLTLNLNKKLKTKATNQEIESFNENLKNLINLSNTINQIFNHNNWVHGSWDGFYQKVLKLQG
ncbi:putative cullin-associated NEDD8-dissociated protein 1 [[Candida] jaroonii]|uniref:Cullin-associated NEDD8-dissociated protein 1 n=1 Tax=[Candida] jaroonii TaxID=467808 RepID=A0ACA9YGN8_9ASCO|nr:putative cullin-associated NEDD8-dissociated protein 1 [[Candida] jaroonii]